jgi:hypothetical protein
VLEISGTPKNVSLARHAHAVLTRTIKSEWATYRTTRRVPARARLDFALGIIGGFRQKIDRLFQKFDTQPHTRALMRVRDVELETYFRLRYPRTRSFSRNSRQRCAGAETAGREIGRRLTISKAVENNARQSSMCLPGGK